MVKRNLTVPFEFVCFTEDPSGIDTAVTIKELPVREDIKGWWYKPMFFNPGLGIRGTVLFVDLDVIVFKNIDNLFNYKPGKFLIIRDFNRHLIKNYEKFNSSIFRLETGQHRKVYDDFIKDPVSVIKRYHGDQDWIRVCIKTEFEYWPDEWIQSYKWEMRGKPKMVRTKNGKKNFETAGSPTIKPQTSIAVFHGDPNPHDCIDPWCKENWY